MESEKYFTKVPTRIPITCHSERTTIVLPLNTAHEFGYGNKHRPYEIIVLLTVQVELSNKRLHDTI